MSTVARNSGWIDSHSHVYDTRMDRGPAGDDRALQRWARRGTGYAPMRVGGLRDTAPTMACHTTFKCT